MAIAQLKCAAKVCSINWKLPTKIGGKWGRNTLHCIRAQSFTSLRGKAFKVPHTLTCHPHTPTLIITFHFSTTIFIFLSLFAHAKKKQKTEGTGRCPSGFTLGVQEKNDEDELPLLRYSRNIRYRYARGLI